MGLHLNGCSPMLHANATPSAGLVNGEVLAVDDVVTTTNGQHSEAKFPEQLNEQNGLLTAPKMCL